MKQIPSRLLNRVTLHAITGAVVASCCLARTSQTEAPARTLHFPPDRSLGMLYIGGTEMEWEYLGEATGEVAVPGGKRVRLQLNDKSGNNLSPLTKLGPDHLHELQLARTADDDCLAHVAHLSGLKALHFPRSYPAALEGPCTFSAAGLKRLAVLKALERLTAPEQLSDEGLAAVVDALPQLKVLRFNQNQLTDAGLAVLPRLRSLEELIVGGGKFTNAGLAALAKLRSLHHLELWGNEVSLGDRVTDDALLLVRQVPVLRTLGVPSTFTDAGLAHLAGHPTLQSLNLYGTRVTDRGLAHLTSLPMLKKLNLMKPGVDYENRPITEAGIAELKKIRTLEQLDLPDVVITDALLADLAQLRNLKSLWIGGSGGRPFSDAGMKHLARLQSLEALTLHGKGISAVGISSIAELKNLRSLTLGVAEPAGGALAGLGTMRSLEELRLSGKEIAFSDLNKLNGLPRLKSLRVQFLVQDKATLDLGRLPQLEYLMLSAAKGSRFRDDDLACLANLKRLRWVQMGTGNDITDAGMAHLAGLTALDRLVLGGSGVTDRGLAALANMRKLDLARISGSFTDAGLQHLEGLTGLRSLTIHSANNFSEAAKQRLRDHLPNLYQLTADADRAAGNAATSPAHPKPGTLAPDFTVTTLDDAQFTLSKHRGKVVLLHFWATWCTPCVKGLPAMKTFHDRMKQKYGDRVVLLDLAMDDSEPKLRSVVATHKLTTPQARIGQGSKLAASYGVTSAPDDFMIGPDGRILLNRESPEGPGDTERVIDQALGLAAKKPAPQPMRPVVVRRPQR